MVNTQIVMKPMKFNSKGSVIFQEMSQIERDHAEPDMIINEESKKTESPALQIEKPEQKGSEGPPTSLNTNNASMPAG